MALAANRELSHYIDQELRTFRVAASTTIYKGGFASLQVDGYVAPLTAGERCVGIAYENCDNSAGADAAKSVRVYTRGDFEHVLTGAVITHLDRPVFASADNTLTFTANGNSFVRTVQDLVVNGTIILRLQEKDRPVKTVVHAVEDLSAGADIAARAIFSFGHQAWIIQARVVNQASAAAGIDDSNTCVVTIANTAGTVVAETFDATTTFPAANTAQDLGTLANKDVPTGDVLTLTVTNGATANPGPFLVEVDYV